MAWNSTWKLPPTGAELYYSDGDAKMIYIQFLKSLSKTDMQVYESLLEGKLAAHYPESKDSMLFSYYKSYRLEALQ